MLKNKNSKQNTSSTVSGIHIHRTYNTTTQGGKKEGARMKFNTMDQHFPREL